MSGGLPGVRLPTIVTCLIDKLPHRFGYHGGVRYCRCDDDGVTYIYGLTPCHEPAEVEAPQAPKAISIPSIEHKQRGTE